MNDEPKNIEELGQDLKGAELSTEDLNEVTGGAFIRKGYDLELASPKAPAPSTDKGFKDWR